MTDSQLQILAAALRAETNQGVVAALAIRDDYTLMTWCNSASAQDAWAESVSKQALFEAMSLTSYDGLSAPKRDAWRLLLDNAPLDMSRGKIRAALPDIWGASLSIPILQACTRKATRAELYLGSSIATTNTVAALKLDVPGLISVNDVSEALNRF